MNQAYAATAIVLLACSGLVASNFLYDRGAPGRLSRRAAHLLGGVAYLMAVLWLDAWMAITLSGVLALCILVLKLGFRRGLRGLSRSDSTQDWAEVIYPMAGTVSLAVGWGLLGDKWLAFLPIAFMAWGDSVAGLVRGTGIWRGKDIGKWPPSAAMLGVCLAAAVLFQPYWIGALGAVAATAGERFSPHFPDQPRGSVVIR